MNTLAAAAIAATIMTANPSLHSSTVATLARELRRYPPIIMYLAYQESTFNPRAANGECVGLMGINATLWSEELMAKKIIRSPKELYHIGPALRAGHYILRKYNYDIHKYQGRNRR